jgi:transposase
MEIITGVERRRRWRVEDKLRIVAETEQPGACFVEVARRHEVCRSLLWNWRRQVQRGTLRADPAPVFLPVRVTGQQLPLDANHHGSPVVPRTNAAVNDDKIEITLTDGTLVRAGHDISLVTLRRVMAALRG